MKLKSGHFYKMEFLVFHLKETELTELEPDPAGEPSHCYALLQLRAKELREEGGSG